MLSIPRLQTESRSCAHSTATPAFSIQSPAAAVPHSTLQAQLRLLVSWEWKHTLMCTYFTSVQGSKGHQMYTLEILFIHKCLCFSGSVGVFFGGWADLNMALYCFLFLRCIQTSNCPSSQNSNECHVTLLSLMTEVQFGICTSFALQEQCLKKNRILNACTLNTLNSPYEVQT